MEKFRKETLYLLEFKIKNLKRWGQYELTTLDNELCFFMYDTLKYEYFERQRIKSIKEDKTYEMFDM